MKKFKYILQILITVLISNNLFAQQSISLNQAIDLGLANSFDVLIEQKNVEVAKNNNNWGEAGRLPNVTFTPAANNNSTFNQPSNPFAVAGTQRSHSITGRINAAFTLYNGRTIQISKQRLEDLEKQSNFNASIVIENKVQEITRAYYNVLLEQEKLEVFKKVMHLSKDKYDYAVLKKELGTGGSFDLMQEKTNYLNDSINTVNQDLAVNNAFRTLNLALSEMNINKQYSLTDKLEIKPIVYNLNNLFTEASANNSTLNKQRVAQALLERDVELQKASVMPKVDLNVGYNGNKNWFNAELGVASMPNPEFDQSKIVGDMTWDNYFDYQSNGIIGIRERTTLSGHNYGPFANLTATITLFNGGKVKRGVQNSKINFERSRLETQRTELSINRDIANAYNLYNTRVNLLSINRMSKEASSLSLQLSEERFKTGTINSFDYRQIQNQYLNAALNEIQAIYNLLDTNSEIMRLTGKIAQKSN